MICGDKPSAVHNSRCTIRLNESECAQDQGRYDLKIFAAVHYPFCFLDPCRCSALVLDIVSGPYLYYGPDYMKSREMYLAESVNPYTNFASDAWMQFAADFTGDGWPDVISVLTAEQTAVRTLQCREKWMATASPKWFIWAKDTFGTPSRSRQPH